MDYINVMLFPDPN